MAAGLQRLGAAVGALADPFAMMNASINDPGALQDSLINMTKQFSYFDEKTKTFKISPQGILTMKEIAKETGISYDNLAKSAIGAQELDKRLSQIKPSIKFGSEEDKQYIANLGAMNAEGEYTIKMDSGIEKKLTDLTQQEFDDLIKQQKEAPKTVEDIARMQLKSSDAAKAALESINKAYYNGVVSARFVRENIDAINKGATITTGALSQNVSTERFRTTFENIFDTARERISKVVQDPSKIGEVIKQSLDDLKKGSGNISKDLLGEAKGIIENLEKSKGQVGKDSFIGQQFDNFIKKLGDIEAIQKAPTVGGKTGTKVEPIVSSILFGNQQQALQNYVLSENKTEIKESKTTVDFTGDVTFKVVAPPGMSAQQFETYIASDEFKKLVYNHWLSKSKELERVR